jgi:hypothetical protein
MSVDLFHELFVALLTCCRDRLRSTGKATSVEMLAVSRRVLRDHGYICPVNDEASRRKLEEMHRLYVKRLEEALRTRPSAAVLAEVRHFLDQSGLTRDLQGAMSNAQAVALMADSRLPFKTIP